MINSAHKSFALGNWTKCLTILKWKYRVAQRSLDPAGDVLIKHRMSTSAPLCIKLDTAKNELLGVEVCLPYMNISKIGLIFTGMHQEKTFLEHYVFWTVHYDIHNKNQQDAHFFINDLMLLLCLWHVSNVQVLILHIDIKSIKHILPSTRLLVWTRDRNTIKLHVQVFLKMNTWIQ